MRREDRLESEVSAESILDFESNLKRLPWDTNMSNAFPLILFLIL